MDNKTLALLGLGAALTAFLSHQSYQNTGSALAWTGFSDPPAAERTVSKTAGDPEPAPPPPPPLKPPLMTRKIAG